MRKLLLPLLIIPVLFGCKSDPCKDVSCQNGGICFEGKCVCPNEYEGVNCETRKMADFTGSYSATETCNLGNFTYSIEISSDSTNEQGIIISNLADLGQSVNAVVTGTTFDIAAQVVDNDTISGSGELMEDILNISYELVPDSGQTLTCTVECVIQE
ncbi:MAG: hypothetical protein GC178_17095 [Flavobacteriales bacterium]|nr:hypothetical protein [Flavobacteriales bacterium]